MIGTLAGINHGRLISRRTPNEQSFSNHVGALGRGFDDYIEGISPGKDIPLQIKTKVPDAKTDLGALYESFNNNNQFGSVSGPDQLPPTVYINPNADRVFASHELGHIASRETDAGRLVSSLRANPALSGALGAALLGVPFVASAIEDGDDDLDTSVIAAALAASPTLVDEVAATYHGNRITDKAGLRTSLGQHGKMAGGLLSYMALPLIAGVSGNFLGNQFDEDV